MRLLLVTNRTMGRIVLEDVEPSKSGSLKGFLLKGSIYIYVFICLRVTIAATIRISCRGLSSYNRVWG